ncbi:alpha-amylase family glycosyl hydrolase [Kibdelosporangium persicum]|uniref:Trehalose-6-phosphate hydrolase n=1 Tax=Kibdelosporangium persicum TaxID=2698649 RepID=A0ABX2F6A6_9PSEU|nr:alpha-amylase family glycosyl hydrolase [Kibdelosporangium persicum]NRN66880.1 Trehalose-6-phosphate hydrolase [Kibdelosporangium persicum]
MTGQHPWWREAVVYQVYPRSFADAAGDGVGDLAGIRQHLDHVRDLGADAIWLSPVYRSPMADAGYDISDHTDIDPAFGDLADMDALLAEAHRLGLRVLMDFVPNHTSDQHPWFRESRSSRDNPKRDWYIWRDEPNNWRAALGAGSAWTWDEQSGQYYLHLFLPEQPDLNWRNPDVVAAMHDVLRFWLDRGVDGFRIDVAHCVGKDPQFADDPRCAAGQPLSDFNDQPYSHEVLRGLRGLIDSYPGDRVLVGEVNIRSTRQVAEYYGADDELHMSFNFPPLDAPWDPVVFRMCVREVERELGAAAAWPTWVLSNHDNERHRTRYGGSLRRTRAAAVMLLSLRGTPFLFQGEELGLENAVITPENRVDPGGRDGSRAPIPWLARHPHGWSGKDPWLPFPPDAGELSAQSSAGDPGSVLRLYRRLIAERRRSPALRAGDWTELPSPPEVLAYARRADADTRITVINFADHPRRFDVRGDWQIRVSSDGDGQGEAFTGRLLGEQALLLEPRQENPAAARSPV